MIDKTSEHVHQRLTVEWLRVQHGLFVFKIPNDGKRSKVGAGRAAAEGLVAGAPDFMVPALRLFVEMKKEGGSLSRAQREFHTKLRDCGYTVLVCVGFDDARKQIGEVIACA